MSVDLKKNKDQILDAWKKVTENEDGYDWALFGYESKSTILKLVIFFAIISSSCQFVILEAFMAHSYICYLYSDNK